MSANKKARKDFVTKEFFILFTPFLASYLWTVFYEAGYAEVFGIPYDLISLNSYGVLLTNRLTLLAGTVAFLWIGLYYNLLPSLTSPLFKGLITVILILAISLGFTFGRSEATSKKIFPVLNTEPPMVVVKIYGDKLVAAKFNPKTRVVRKEFSIFKLGEHKNLSFSIRTVGPLIVK